MFPSSVNLFKEIDCPSNKDGKCKLPHCIFRHTIKRPLNSRPESQPESQPKRVGAPSGTAAVASRPEPQLVPKQLNEPSAVFALRLQYLKTIRSKLEDFGTPRSNQLAIDLEAEECKSSTQYTYKMNIRNLIRRISRGEYKPGHRDERELLLKERARDAMALELTKLVLPVEKLTKYITEIPDGVYEPQDRFKCERCKQACEFEKLVPDLRQGIERCRFHLLRRIYNPAKRRLDDTFPCCGATLDMQGCEARPSHVYKLVEPSALHAKIKFVPTPNHDHGSFALGMDCEMAYTTNGMELIRVTAMDWFTNAIVLDRIVKPMGTVLDLNTRFSGVSDISAGITIEGKHYPPISFYEARRLLCELLSAKTILVGHGLENDLIIMRLIHHRIVDTAILYPRVKTRTHSLKQLAWMYLSRTIQTGEHDSKEDSLAAMDVVKKDIEERLA